MGSNCCHHPSAARGIAALVGRILVGAIFLLAALYEYNHWSESVTALANLGLPEPSWILGIAIFFKALGAAGLILGYKARKSALLLILVLVPATFLFHSFWAFPLEERALEFNYFVTNLFYIGSLLLVAAFGSGPYSFDACGCKRSCKS